MTDLKIVAESRTVVICTSGGEIRRFSYGAEGREGEPLVPTQTVGTPNPADSRAGCLISAAHFECRGVGGTVVVGVEVGGRSIVLSRGGGGLLGFAAVRLSSDSVPETAGVFEEEEERQEDADRAAKDKVWAPNRLLQGETWKKDAHSDEVRRWATAGLEILRGE